MGPWRLLSEGERTKGQFRKSCEVIETRLLVAMSAASLIAILAIAPPLPPPSPSEPPSPEYPPGWLSHAVGVHYILWQDNCDAPITAPAECGAAALALGLGNLTTSPHFLSAATARVTEEVLLDGLRVFEANDVAHAVYIIADGEAELLCADAAGVEHRVATCSIGDVIGAESAFTGNVMPWAARAVGATRALKLASADIAALFEGFAADERRVTRVLIDATLACSRSSASTRASTR